MISNDRICQIFFFSYYFLEGTGRGGGQRKNPDHVSLQFSKHFPSAASKAARRTADVHH